MTSGWAELRTRLASVDPGLTRLHLASVATASMIVAALLMSGVRALSGQPVTVVLFAVVLAMISNLAVNEPKVARRRVTTALMVLPAGVSAVVSSVLADQRVVADIVFVLVMMAAVAVRRYGPRGNALGMAAFMPYFFVQFLKAGPAELPYLLTGVVIGIGSTFVLRGLVFTERPERVVERVVRAFEARLHGLLTSVLAVLETTGDPELDDVAERQAKLNETALLVADRLDDIESATRNDAKAGDSTTGDSRTGDSRTGDTGDRDAEADAGGTSEAAGLRQWIVDSELAAERLAVATRRMVEHHDRMPDDHRLALADGVRALMSATAVGTPRDIAGRLYDTARSAVGGLAQGRGAVDAAAREQRIAFAVIRLADAMQTTVGEVAERIAERDGDPDADPSAHGRHEASADRPSVGIRRLRDGEGLHTRYPDPEPEREVEPPEEPARDTGMALHTRQAIQVGVASSLAIVAGELISPARWYWAVIAAFVVFAGTSSRGDVLSRGWARIVGTVGGVAAGMLLALLVGGNLVLSLVLLFACVFLALYLVRVSQAMMAFWITAVLALLYGVIGQFSVETLLLRVEETAVGGALGMLAAFLVLPARSRTAFGEALDDALATTSEVLVSSVDRVLGRSNGTDPLETARKLDTQVATVRERSGPLEHPIVRRPLRRGVRHTVRVVSGLDHYSRLLAAQSRTLYDPRWAPTLLPAAHRVEENLDGLRHILRRGYGRGGSRDARDGPLVRSAEDLIDAAEAAASRETGTETERLGLLAVSRMLRRIDQLAGGLSRELTGGSWTEPVPARAGSGADGGTPV